jgi:hypothetical protein
MNGLLRMTRLFPGHPPYIISQSYTSRWIMRSARMRRRRFAVRVLAVPPKHRPEIERVFMLLMQSNMPAWCRIMGRAFTHEVAPGFVTPRPPTFVPC